MKPDRTSTQRGRGADKEVKRKRERHPAEQQLYSHIRAQSYHRQHLLDLLKLAIEEQDHDRAAVAAAVMLAAQDPSYVPGPDMLSETKTSQYFPDIAAAALEVLRQQVTTEELKRFIRKMHDHQNDPEQAEFATFELVYSLAEQGNYQEGYDVLDSSCEKSSQHFQRAAVCGFLRHAQVCEILEKTAKQHTASQPGQSSRPRSNMFQHEEQVWSKGGQQLQEFWHGAEAHLKEALRLQPRAVAEACLLAQLYMMAGLPQDALETARALRHNAPADADSHALFILMKESEGPSADSVNELAQAYVEMLRCDPASQCAVQGLLGLNTRLTVSPTVLLEAAALHLDVAHEHSPSALQAWKALAHTLSTAAKHLGDLQAKAALVQSMAAEKADRAARPACSPQQGAAAQASEQPAAAHNGQHQGVSPIPGGRVKGQTPEVDGHAERQPRGAEGQAEGEPQGNALSNQQGSGSEGSELQAAWDVWQAFRDLLPVERCWWVKLHFRWQESPAASEPGEPPDDPNRLAVLRAKAITAALMYNAESDVGTEDSRNAFVPRVQDHIEAAGEFGVAQDIDDAVELGESIRKALLKQAAEVKGMPFDTPLAEFALVSNLPQVWWSVFPFKRRQYQQ